MEKKPRYYTYFSIEFGKNNFHFLQGREALFISWWRSSTQRSKWLDPYSWRNTDLYWLINAKKVHSISQKKILDNNEWNLKLWFFVAFCVFQRVCHLRNFNFWSHSFRNFNFLILLRQKVDDVEAAVVSTISCLLYKSFLSF